MTSQWERLLRHEGTWIGSFTQLSPQGGWLQTIPSRVVLQSLNQGASMRQVIYKYPPDAAPQETVLEYRSLSQSVLFFANGAFSQGSIQWGPLSAFGAELGLLAGDERLRLVQSFEQQQLSRITLICEHRQGTPPPQRSPLTVAALLGTWEGEATTLYRDLRPSQAVPTRLTLTRSGDQVTQQLEMDGQVLVASTGRCQEHRIHFQDGPQPVQVLLLPAGASATGPAQITSRQPLFLEVGWLLSPDHRQRLIRTYNAQGSWVSLTLVEERRVSLG